jgi:hypothetical protein
VPVGAGDAFAAPLHCCWARAAGGMQAWRTAGQLCTKPRCIRGGGGFVYQATRVHVLQHCAMARPGLWELREGVCIAGKQLCCAAPTPRLPFSLFLLRHRS